MRKIILLFVLALITSIGYSQKKKKGTAKTNAGVLAKVDNLSAEIVKNELHVYFLQAGKKEILFSRPVENAKNISDCKITGFNANATPLYAISWKENKLVKTDLKTEDITSTVHEVWDVATKTQAIANIQTATHIKEKVFLDQKRTVSETQEKMRKEGLEFILTPQGDVVLKGKTQESKLVYNPTEKKFIAKKK